MNVQKIAGRGLIGMGLLLMVFGTATVPSSSWAGSVGLDCTHSCNHCGDAEHQGGGIYQCISKSSSGVPSDGYCDKTATGCTKCLGSCSKVMVKDLPKCKCDESERRIDPEQELLE